MRSTDKPADNNSNDNNSIKKKTLSFGMVQLKNSTSEKLFESNTIGPLLDDGAPYSGIGLEEFLVMQPLLLPKWNGKLDPVPDHLSSYKFWQYGSGEHASASRKIIGSVSLTAHTNNNHDVQIKHLIIEGSSQWVVGRNVTRRCNINHANGNTLQIPQINDYISLADNNFHSHIPLNTFTKLSRHDDYKYKAKLFCATAKINQNENTHTPWSEIKKIVDKVHQHICGHSQYSDIKILLQRNNLWNEEVNRYLSTIMEKCTSCKTTSVPQPSRKVSLSSLSRQFNDLVCIDHLHLENNRVFHVMDSHTRYSSGMVVQSLTMTEAIKVFECQWMSQFWAPKCILFDPAFDNDEFLNYAHTYDIETKPIPPRRHNKNVIESKHKIIRDIYLRIKHSNEDNNLSNDEVLVQQALKISNDLYGNDTCSAFELAKGYTRPVQPGMFPVYIPDELIEAREQIHAKRKLVLILRSKSITDIQINPGDLVQVFIKDSKEKRGKWSTPKIVLDTDIAMRTVSVPGKMGKKVRAAFEDIRPAIKEDTFAATVQEAIDNLSTNIDELLEDVQDNDMIEVDTKITNNEVVTFDTEDDESLTRTPEIGDYIDVYWPLDEQYYTGKISSISTEGEHNIDYTDGDKECLSLKNETWKFTADETLQSNNLNLTTHSLTSNAEAVISSYLQVFGQRPFMKFQAQGLPLYPLINSYQLEEDSFIKTVKLVHVSDVPKDANIITSHVIYKVKSNDDGTYKMKARIAPHGNKDKEKEQLKTDSCPCPPTGIRMLLSLATIMKWPVAKIDFKSAFLQTGFAQRDVYVVPPRESRTKNHYWLLLTAAYGLVNANAKWQNAIDNYLTTLGFLQVRYIPQLFYVMDTQNNLSIVATKIVDDVLFCGELNTVTRYISKIQEKYELGTIYTGPGSFLFCGLNIIQDEDFNITINGDSKINNLSPFNILRYRRKETNKDLNAIELSSFRSINTSLGWIGQAVSPFCSFYSSYLQQKLPSPIVSDLISQINILKHLQKLGTTIKYIRPTEKKDYEVSILVFSDASRKQDDSKLAYVCGILIGEFQVNSTWHILSWSSRKSGKPVKSIATAEIIAASEAIDEGKVIKNAIQFLLNMEIKLILAVDSNNLYEALSTSHTSSDRSIRGEVGVIRYEFETHNVDQIRWIPGKVNLSDALTKPNSSLTEALQLSLFTSTMTITVLESQCRHSRQFTG